MGMGVVGTALYDYLTVDNREIVLKLYDPAKDFNDDLSACDVVFICVPAATLEDRTQDLSAINHCLKKLFDYKTFFTKPIILKSTVLPGTTYTLAQQYLLRVYHMPEFLTERRALEDMHDHQILCGGRDTISYEHKLLIEAIFRYKEIIWVANKEAELTKYAHNSFCALKVNFFNTIFMACNRLGANYDYIKHGLSISGFIEPTHLSVPGPDTKFGYGGKCLPKDLKAFIGLLKQKGIATGSLEQTEIENEFYRSLS
jgi:nucleotide sugar dehydrogenase